MTADSPSTRSTTPPASLLCPPPLPAPLGLHPLLTPPRGLCLPPTPSLGPHPPPTLPLGPHPPPTLPLGLHPPPTPAPLLCLPSLALTASPILVCFSISVMFFLIYFLFHFASRFSWYVTFFFGKVFFQRILPFVFLESADM